MKRIFEPSSVNAGDMNNVMQYPVIQSGKNFVIRGFGASDRNLGDNISGVWILQVGATGNWDILQVLSYTGYTDTVPLKISITGDGVKRVRVLRRNYSSSAKEMPYWIDYEEG